MGSAHLRKAVAWLGLGAFMLGVQVPLALNRHVLGGTDALCRDLPLGLHDRTGVDTASPVADADEHCALCHLRGTTRATDHPPLVSLSLPTGNRDVPVGGVLTLAPRSPLRQIPSRAPPAA